MHDTRYDYLFEEEDELSIDIDQARVNLDKAKESELLRREINSYEYVRVNHYTKILRKKS